jgi:replicative DNA helicase
MAVGHARKGTPTAVFSLEMDKPSLGLRILSAVSRVNARRIEHDELIERSMEWDNVREARAELSRLPLYVDDTPGLTAMQLRARVRRMIAEHGVKAVYIDYLQRMTGDPKLPREQQVATLSKTTADLAREFGVSVQLLAQLNRQAESREGHRPRLSDLRESGAIEQDADVVALIHRPDYYAIQKDRSHQPDGVAEVIIAKQRNGPTGVVRLHFDAETAAMHNAASSEQEAAQEEIVYG